MTERSDEERLRRLFAELRRDDLARAPGFARVRARAAGRERRPALRPWLAAAGTALAGLALVWAVRAPAPPGVPPLDRAALARAGRWHSPTDFLLRLPGEPIVAGTPQLHFGRLPARPDAT